MADYQSSRNALKKEHVTELYRSCHDSQQPARRKGTESSLNMQSILQPYMALNLIVDTKEEGLVAKTHTKIEKKREDIRKITEEKIHNGKQVSSQRMNANYLFRWPIAQAQHLDQRLFPLSPMTKTI